MRRILAFCVSLAVATAFGGIVFAQTKPGADPAPGVDPKPDAMNGERLALQWCASCHVVAPAQQQATAAVPTFAEIARRPGFNAAQLALFLLNPHPVMPNMALTRKEAADLAAYIAAQRK
jgi:mono/diheme cytochrome c family protein